MLSYMLYEKFKPICIAFSPPGQTIFKCERSAWDEHVVSVVMGNDIVPRLSTYSLFHYFNVINKLVFTA